MVSGTAAILVFVPLYQVLGFEFAVALGALATCVSGWTAVACAADARHARVAATSTNPVSPVPDAFPGAALGRTLLGNLALLPLPIALVSLNALRVPNCDWREGLLFVGVIAVPALLYGTSLGFLLGLRFEARRGRLLWLAWMLSTIAWALVNVVRQPPIFAFNAVWAYFPGPVYDRVVSLDARLLLARALVLLEATTFLCAAAVFWESNRLRWRAVRLAVSGWRAVPALVGVLALSTFLLMQIHADRLGLRISRQYIQQQLGGRIETQHCTIYYAEQSYTAESARELAQEHEFHYAELRQWFGIAPQHRIRSYVYASAEQKKRLMGAGGTNFEDALNDEFHINAAPFPHPVLRHEMAHIFAAQIDRWWPVCPLMGIHEGLAVAAEWRQASGSSELTADEACVAMQQLGVLPDLEKTLSAFGFWTQASARAYTVAGSFVHDLVQTHGMPAMRRLWSSRDFEATYDRSLRQLIDEWQQRRLDPIHLNARQMRLAQAIYLRHSVFQEPCAHEQAQLRRDAALALVHQPRRADSLYARLQEIDATASSAWFGRLRAVLRAGDADTALQLVEDMCNRLPLRAADSTAVWRLQGDAFWLRGDFAAATQSYRRALQEAAARATRRALEVNLAVLQSAQQRDLLRDYLIESLQNDTASLTLLATARGREPQSPWPRYLLGRRLYFAGRFAEAITELQPLAAADLPVDIHLATLELLAWSHLRLGQPQACLELLDDSAAAPWTAAEALRLEDLRRRAEAARIPSGP